MPYFTYDTSVIVSRNIRLHEMSSDFLLSAVVLMEPTAGAADNSVRKTYERLFHQYRRDKLLIVPNDDDWLLAAKIMFLLAEARRWPREAKATAPRSVATAGIGCLDRGQCAKMEGAGGHRELGGLQGHPALLQRHHHQSGAVL